MKNLFLSGVVLMIVLAFLFSACKTSQVSTRVTKKDSSYTSTEVTHRDTTVAAKIPGGSAEDHSKDVTMDEQKWKDLVKQTERKYGKRIDSLMAAYMFKEVGKSKGLINSGGSLLKTRLAWSLAYVRGGKLFHELHQPDTTIQLRLENALTEIRTLQSRITSTDTVSTVVKNQSFFQRVWAFIKIWFVSFILAAIALVAGYLLGKFVKFKFL